MWLPTNDDTKTIQYDTKFLKSAPGRYPALKWTVTKVEDTATDGITKFTVAQTQFDPAKDNVELGIADYWESAVEPSVTKVEEIVSINQFEIMHSGASAVKAGGGYKKFVLKQYSGENLNVVSDPIKWFINTTEIKTDANGACKVKLPVIDYSKDKIIEEIDEALSVTIKDGEIKIKCTDEYILIGQKFTLTAATDGGTKSLVVEVTSL